MPSECDLSGFKVKYVRSFCFIVRRVVDCPPHASPSATLPSSVALVVDEVHDGAAVVRVVVIIVVVVVVVAIFPATTVAVVNHGVLFINLCWPQPGICC